ncbi:MAG TPA: CoA pyrophosphatase [Acidimicrobiales bacterium]|nr:CoA pyrophosphatase [Acidimicrobiales bacterium]
MGAAQRIPRPPGARPGTGPPWAWLPPERRRGLDLAVVRRAVAGRAAPEPWREPLGTLPAAVLVALFEEEGEARVVLTRRARHLRSHTGEVSFPGGRLEPGEAPEAGALREAGEEVGLDRAAVEIVGQLAPLPTLSSSSLVTPFVGALAGRPVLRPHPAEVELAFDVSLAELMSEGVYRQERWDLPGSPDRPVHFFHLPTDVVWGATARILHELLGLVAEQLRAPSL